MLLERMTKMGKGARRAEGRRGYRRKTGFLFCFLDEALDSVLGYAEGLGQLR